MGTCGRFEFVPQLLVGIALRYPESPWRAAQIFAERKWGTT